MLFSVLTTFLRHLRKKDIFFFLVVELTITSSFVCTVVVVNACTDMLVTPGASIDNSSMIAYNADSPTLYGVLYHYPASTATSSNNASSTTTTRGGGNKRRKIYDWDSGAYLGEIDWDYNQQTYNVIGNGNERGLVIGESTFGGVSQLAWNQTSGKIDYGSLIYMTLQACEFAKEAIHYMVNLVNRYGYVSGGESFSIADRTGDVWYVEMISTGSTYTQRKLGVVYVARKLPDGTVSAHANHARITTFPRNDPNNCLYSDDVIDVAIHYGLYDHNDKEFSFSDVYDPLTFGSARQGEARVWSIFSNIVDTTGNFSKRYEQYALGYDLSNRMPLWVYPHAKLSVLDVMKLMNSHYENAPLLDSSNDVGSGLFESPYRPRPLVWEYNNDDDNKKYYHNERSIATPKTGWNFVAQVRSNVPIALSAILWWAADDSSTSPRTPVYASSTKVSKAYRGQGPQDGVVSPILTFDTSKIFWVQNMVSNFVYMRWNDMYPLLRSKIDNIQKKLHQKTRMVDQIATKLYKDKGQQAAVDYLTLFSVNVQTKMHQLWLEYYGYLFVRYRDYWTIQSKPSDPACGCEAIEPGLSNTMKERIIKETGDRYKVPDDDDDHGAIGGGIGGTTAGEQPNKKATKVLFGEHYYYRVADSSSSRTAASNTNHNNNVVVEKTV